MKRLLLLAALVVPSCSRGGGGDGAPPGPVPVSTSHPVDGVVSFDGLATYTATIAFYDTTPAFVKNTTVTYAFTNDDEDLYVAVEWTDDTFNNGMTWTGPTDFDGVQLHFDTDGDGTWEVGEDKRFIIAATVGSQYLDQHRTGTPAEDDLCGDGRGAMRYDSVAQKWRAEFLIPLDPDAQNEDGALTAATRFNIALFDHVELALGTGNQATRFAAGPAGTDSAAWATLPIVAVAAIPRPAIPAGLTGLVVFISDHEDAKGEIYTFNPATGVVFRVTTNSFFEDCISLSHDRQWIAFHGAANKTDYSSYEIYKIKVDGTGWAQLTSNSILDGHPGWSPNDLRLCYASFRDAGTASIVVMTAAGVEIADLTTFPDDDNDPDYLPDGRIVFKTSRFNALPQVKIATMNEDGTGVQQVTFNAVSPNTSDHDPIGDATYAIFERFTKGTDYSADVESLFSPWHLIEARLDGAGERVVVSDIWANWLPVYDPTGAVIVHLKSMGYTEIHLLSRDGLDYGRWVPNITKVRYLDWK